MMVYTSVRAMSLKCIKPEEELLFSCAEPTVNGMADFLCTKGVTVKDSQQHAALQSLKQRTEHRISRVVRTTCSGFCRFCGSLCAVFAGTSGHVQ